MKNKKDENIAATSGAGAGIIGIGVVAHGSSASAITSTLATIGMGSMATGVIVVAAIPVITGLIALGGYKLYKNRKNKIKEK